MDFDEREEELLILIGLCGDFPNTLIKDLLGGRSWKYKTLQHFQEDGFLKRYKKDGLTSLRLTKKGSHYLHQKYPQRFQEQQKNHLRYQQSDRRKRQRLHDVATAQIMAHTAGVTIYPDQKPAVFAKLPALDEKATFEKPCFYTSFELKAQYDETIKIRSTRAVGALLSSTNGYMVYNVNGRLIKWASTSERKLFSVVESSLLHWQLHYAQLEAIMIGQDYQTAYQYLTSTGGYRNVYFRLDETYPAFYFLPSNKIGRYILRLLCQNSARQKLKRYLFYRFALETSPQAAIFPYDALKDGRAVLLAYENDLEKLKGFKAGLEQFEERGLVICLAEQLEMLSQYFAHLVDIQTIPASLLEKALNSE